MGGAMLALVENDQHLLPDADVVIDVVPAERGDRPAVERAPHALVLLARRSGVPFVAALDGHVAEACLEERIAIPTRRGHAEIQSLGGDIVLHLAARLAVVRDEPVGGYE